MLTARDFFEMKKGNLDGDETIAVIETQSNGSPSLWIEKHNEALTVVDCNSSASELGFRDDSSVSIDEIEEWWSKL